MCAVTETKNPSRICLKCGYIWEQKKLGGKPRQCPACNSRQWDRDPTHATPQRKAPVRPMDSGGIFPLATRS